MNHLCYITHSVSSRHNSKHLFKNVVLTTTPYRGTSHGAMNNPPRNICDSRQSLRYKYGLVRFGNLPFNFGRPPGPVFLPPPFFFFCETHPPPCISHLPSYWIANQSPENTFTRSRSIQWIFHTRSYACCRAFLTLTPPLCRFFRGKPPVQIEHQIYSFPLPPSVPLTIFEQFHYASCPREITRLITGS